LAVSPVVAAAQCTLPGPRTLVTAGSVLERILSYQSATSEKELAHSTVSQPLSRLWPPVIDSVRRRRRPDGAT